MSSNFKQKSLLSLSNRIENHDRPSSVPPRVLSPMLSDHNLNNNRSSSIPPGSERSRTSSDPQNGISLDLMGHLQRSGPSVVKTRTGSVLTRGFILKTDFYPSGRSLYSSATNRLSYVLLQVGLWI